MANKSYGCKTYTLDYIDIRVVKAKKANEKILKLLEWEIDFLNKQRKIVNGKYRDLIIEVE